MADVTLKMLILGEDKGAAKALHNVGSAADDAHGHLQHLRGMIGAVFGGEALIAGAEKAIDFLKESMKGAVEDQEAVGRLTTAIEDNTGAHKEQAGAIAESLEKMSETSGVAKGDLFDAYNKLVTASHSNKQAHQDLSLAMDVSAGTGRDLGSVSLALAKAHEGNIGALGRLGINVKDVHGKTMSLTQVTAEMAKSFHGQAEEKANSLAGQMGRLHNTFRDFQDHLGSRVIPILNNLAQGFLTKALPAIKQIGGYVSDKLVPIFRDAWPKIQAIVSNALDIIKQLWRTFGSTIEGWLRTSFENLKQIFSGAFQVIQGIFEAFDGIIHGKWSKFWDGIKLILSGAWKALVGIIKQLWNDVQAAFEIAGTILGAVWKKIWGGLAGVLKDIWNHTLGPVIGWLNSAVSGIGSVLGTLESDWSRLWTKMGQILKGIYDHSIGPVVDAIRGAIDFITSSGSKNYGLGAGTPTYDQIKGYNFGAIPNLKGLTLGVPKHAAGGIFMPRAGGILGSVNGHTGIFAEAGQPEAVIPLNRLSSMVGGGGGTVIHNHFEFNTLPGGEAAVAREVKRILANKARTSGNAQAHALFSGSW